MTFTEKDFDTLSELARIAIPSEEKGAMLSDMQAILSYVSEINDVDLDYSREKEALSNVVRDDVVTRKEGSMTEALLANAPGQKDGYVEVTQVLK